MITSNDVQIDGELITIQDPDTGEGLTMLYETFMEIVQLAVTMQTLIQIGEELAKP